MHNLVDWIQNYWPILLLAMLWVVGHALIIFVAFCRGESKKVALLIVVIFMSVYLLKPATFDLPKYSGYFDYGVFGDDLGDVLIGDRYWGKLKAGSETGLSRVDLEGGKFCPFVSLDSRVYGLASIGFCALMQGLGRILPSGSFLPRILPSNYVADSMVIVVMLVGIVVITMVVSNLTRNQVEERRPRFVPNLLVLSIILGSVFFFVGSQNSIRQFLGIIFVLLSLTFLREKKIWTSLILAMIGLSMHKWAFVFLALGVCLMIIVQIQDRRLEAWPRLKGVFIEASTLGMSIAAVVAIKVVYWNSTNLFVPDDFSQYVEGIRGNEFVGQVSLLLKVGAVLLVFTVSELILGTKRDSQIWFIQLMRRSTLLFCLPLVVFPDIFSRALILYFAIEMLLVACIFQDGSARSRISGAFVFCSYGVAPNALNILIGPAILFEAWYG